MSKIQSIEKFKIATNLIKSTKIATVPKMSPFVKREIPLMATSVAGITLPFLFDYKKTFDDNYFKLPNDKTTGKPLEADVFQKAAAMNLYSGKDVLVTAPTGTGKTAIAKYIITKNLKDNKRTFYTTPLKALSNEKFLDFCKTYGQENVGLLTGDKKINPNAKIVVMTTEVYRNMAAANLFDFNKEKWNDKYIPLDLKTVIFDELQYLGDVDRGGVWEQSIMFTPQNIQLLSLSATIGNNDEINNWLALTKGNKSLNVTPSEDYMPDNNISKESVLINVPTENRHVPLNFQIEHAAPEIKVPRGGTKSQKLLAKKEAARKSQTMMATVDEIAYRYLTKKLNEEGKLPAIYFIFNKKECKHLLKHLSEESELLTTEQERHEIASIIKKYVDSGVYLGENLNTEALMKGYAIHNAGLLPSQKTLIEELFQKKLVKVVLATETLSAGINMPARTTVVSSPRKPASTCDEMADHKRNLTPNEFHQMAGRAGRRGIDEVGYCYAMSCNPVQKEFLNNIISSKPNKLESSMSLDYSFIANYLAEFSDEDVLKKIFSKSLYVYDPVINTVDKIKLQKILNEYNVKKQILYKEHFISDSGKLTLKGELLKYLNGYEQIPVINMLVDYNLTSLNIPELAGIIGGLANLEMDKKDDFPSKYVELKGVKNAKLDSYTKKLIQNIGQYSDEIKDLYNDKEIKLNYRSIEHLYTWSVLNESVDDSKQNWRTMVKGSSDSFIKDEGSLFKEISLTVDLVKQLIYIAKHAESFSRTESEANYFKILSDNLSSVLKLLQREPIQEGI